MFRMEAASRPPLELLPDLPVEEPFDSAMAPARAPAGSHSSPPSGSAAAGRDPEQTGLNFVDPELFLGEGQKASAIPLSAATSAAKDAPESLELVLEDPVVDDLLTAPPPSAAAAQPAAHKPVTASPPVALAPTPAKAAMVEPSSARAAARVPIARTASLAAAASKIAAASSARSRTVPPAVVTPPKATGPAARPAAASPPAAKAAAPAKSTPAGVMSAPPAPPRKVEAQNLASWANARAAAAPRVNAAPAIPTISPPAAAGVVTASAPRVAAAAPTTSPASAAAGVSPGVAAPSMPPMDRDFIARNQVVERYLSGRLPVKGATDFERFCHEHPELLDEIGLPERVNAGVRLLEASGKPEPWHEPPRPVWQRPQVTIGLAAAVGALAVALAIVSGGSAGKTHRIAQLQREATERSLDPATSRREIRLLPSRSGASNTPMITIGGDRSGAQLADFKIDESRSPYRTFRVTIDRIDQGRVGIINNLNKESNGHLRIALNSSALGPGNYQLTLEGLDLRGDAQPDSWVTIGIVR